MKLGFSLPHYHVAEALYDSCPFKQGSLLLHSSFADSLYYKFRFRHRQSQHIKLYQVLKKGPTETNETRIAWESSLEKRRLHSQQGSRYYKKAAHALASHQELLLEMLLREKHLFFFWNCKRFIDRYIIELCRKTQTPYFILEEGLFRPHSMTLDSWGLGVESFFYKNFSNLKMTEKIHFDAPQFSKPYSLGMYQLYKLLDRFNFYSGIKSIKSFENYPFLKGYPSAKATKRPAISSGFHNIFVPLQLDFDSQVLFASEVSSMNLLMQNIEKLLSKLKLEMPGIKFKVYYKDHPAQTPPRDFSTSGEIPFERVDSGLNSKEMIELCDSVFTLNSTVGFEGILHKKPVVTFAKCLYNLDELAFYWDKENFKQLAIYLKSKPDPAKVDLFLGLIQTYYNLPFRPSQLECYDLTLLWSRVQKLMHP